MNSYKTYYELIKPSFAPPSWLFGPVWTFLYVLIAISFGTMFYKILSHKIPFYFFWPLFLNLIFNFLFTPIQFGLRNNFLASIDVILVWLTIVWFMILIWNRLPDMRWVVYMNIPYFLWVSFASVLQITITILNK